MHRIPKSRACIWRDKCGLPLFEGEIAVRAMHFEKMTRAGMLVRQMPW